MEKNYSTFEKLLWNFYIVDPKKYVYENEDDVPDYIDLFSGWISVMIILEHFILLAAGKEGIRFGEGISSLSLGYFRQISRFLIGGIEFYGYNWLYQYRFFDLNWRSPLTWWIAALATDFGYYWFHRACHEINFIWAAHQVHHSSEEFNITSAIRQSGFQKFFSFGIFHPLALLGVPLPAILVHYQLNLIFQIWIHTQLLSKLGPFEWIFNTPSHHRVHHGSNKWCLDKNYAGVLIIWDKIFGTFQAERSDEKIVYGLVDQPQRFETLYLQLFYYRNVYRKALSMSTWTNSLKAMLCGPAWIPGSSRLGDENALPDKTQPRKKYDPKISFRIKIYIFINFISIILALKLIAFKVLPGSDICALVIFCYLTMFTNGSFLDGQSWAQSIEALRCIGTIFLIKNMTIFQFAIMGNPKVVMGILGFHGFFAMYWSFQVVKLWINEKKKKSR